MIYLIYNKELDHVKVGYSKEPLKRLMELQTGNSCKLELIHIEEGSIKQEKQIHSALNEYKIQGEWFEYAKVKNILKTLFKGLVDFDLNYIQIYTTLNNIISKLNSLAAVKLLFWSFNEISKENMFAFNERKISEFNNWLRDHNSEKDYNPRTMYNALKELIDNGIVIKWSNGSYQLNPKFIWSDSIDKRIEHLKQLGEYDSFELIEENK